MANGGGAQGMAPATEMMSAQADATANAQAQQHAFGQ